MLEFLRDNWQGITMVIGGAIAWIYKRPLSKWVLRQNQANVKATQVSNDSTTIDNLEKSMNIYVALIDDIENKLKQKDKELRDAYEEIEILRDRIKELRIQLNQYKK